MKRAILVAALAMVVTKGPAFAQLPDVEAAFEAREAALDRGDEQAWGRLTTDDLIIINADGSVSTKADRMAQIKGRKRTRAKQTELKFRTYGDTVILTGRAEQTPPARFTQVWVKQNGQWRVAGLQISTIAKP